jgi:hypothetical protein
LYSNKPKRFLSPVAVIQHLLPAAHGYCAGFELQEWRFEGLANHLMDWITDYALWGDQLNVSHVNMYERLRRAAARIYKTPIYEKRGEVGELLLHAICRDFFATIPIAPRVFYLTASNEVVKSFDLVHVCPDEAEDSFEVWLGEAKFYKDPFRALADAIESIETHVDAGFLKNEKLILAPQIDPTAPYYAELSDIFSEQTSLDDLFNRAVFPICVAAESSTTAGSIQIDTKYRSDILTELANLQDRLAASALHPRVKLVLLYVPLANKMDLATSFDSKLKGILGC